MTRPLRIREWRLQGAEVVILLTRDLHRTDADAKALAGAVHAFSQSLSGRPGSNANTAEGKDTRDEPLPPLSEYREMLEALKRIASGTTEEADEDLDCMVEVSLSADECAEIARSAISKAEAFLSLNRGEKASRAEIAVQGTHSLGPREDGIKLEGEG